MSRTKSIRGDSELGLCIVSSIAFSRSSSATAILHGVAGLCGRTAQKMWIRRRAPHRAFAPFFDAKALQMTAPHPLIGDRSDLAGFRDRFRQQVVLDREQGRSGTRGDAQFLVDVLGVAADGLRRDEEAAADLTFG